jgi:hypothetical protein
MSEPLDDFNVDGFVPLSNYYPVSLQAWFWQIKSTFAASRSPSQNSIGPCPSCPHR